MSRAKKIVFGLVGLALLLIVAMVVYGMVQVKRPFPTTDGEITVPGLKGTVNVYRDEFGVQQRQHRGVGVGHCGSSHAEFSGTINPPPLLTDPALAAVSSYGPSEQQVMSGTAVSIKCISTT